MDGCGADGFEGDPITVGDRVRLVDDEWGLLGRDIVVVEVEPVPGSTQCLIQADGERRTVSRVGLRRV